MRFYLLMLFCVVLTTTCAEPDPKKYKSEVKDKDKASNTTLTAEEKKFLRDVEAKYGIKNNDPPKEEKKNVKNASEAKPKAPTHFPAVIAIEIVNDTDTKSKGKRTIDANLGYGYKTNNGYTYSYFGKPAQEKGKFMIYPYSQEDIPPNNVQSTSINHYDHSGKIKTSVEIQPSQAFELVQVKDEKPAYHYDKPAIEFTTPAPQPVSYSSADHSSNSYSSHPSTLYTTYNGEQFSGLSGQFPTVMPDYLVDPSQLIKNPEFQSVGLTQDHLHTPGSHLEQKVVPVLVLRIPSSSLTNPTAELYANLPQNYPLSNYLNHLNLQELVNQYFKKAGYKFAPQVMAYPSHGLESQGAEGYSQQGGEAPSSQYEPQNYAHPYVQPTYTQAHLSDGVQYSAVQPVMARYPSSYVRQHYMTMPKGYSIYKQPSLPQNYEYQYQYVPQSAVSSQSYYMPSSHYQQETEHGSSQDYQSSSLDQGADVHDSNAQVQYASVSPSYEAAVTPSAEYGTPGIQYGTPPQHAEAEYEHSGTVAPEYGPPQEQYSQSISPGYESSVTPAPEYGPAKESGVSQDQVSQYYTQTQHDQQDHTVFSPQSGQSSHASQADVGGQQNYGYQQVQQSEQQDDQGLVLTENYPSKDHTIATVLPSHYKTGKQNSGTIQTVSYVTPLPHPKYQMPYRVMVPKTFLYNPSTEKVTYVHSRPMSSSYSQSSHQDYNPETEYTVGYRHVPSIGKQKPSSFPRNYHSHPKRMVKSDHHKTDSSPFSKNKNERNEKKRLS
uniref:SFRICE_017112 n=1 Tax=Spodoptera frugiperda TaxID=7108 RepID=A0A2H1WS31_SPOFR